MDEQPEEAAQNSDDEIDNLMELMHETEEDFADTKRRVGRSKAHLVYDDASRQLFEHAKPAHARIFLPLSSHDKSL